MRKYRESRIQKRKYRKEYRKELWDLESKEKAATEVKDEEKIKREVKS